MQKKTETAVFSYLGPSLVGTDRSVFSLGDLGSQQGANSGMALGLFACRWAQVLVAKQL